MLVITHNTETRLYQDLQDCLRQSPSRRCFFMEFSKSHLKREELFEDLLRVLDDVPNAYMAQIYICQDMDVFVLMQGFMQRHFADFIQNLADYTGHAELARLGHIYEVGHDWATLEKYCLSKLHAIEAAQKQADREAKKIAAELRVTEILSSLSIQDIPQIPQRRMDNKHYNILVVDDDALTRTLIGNLLGGPLKTVYAHNGQEAIREYITAAPDVVFLDIGLPDIHGHQILESLMQIDPQAYIIMISGNKDKRNIMQSLDKGA
ncbi:MAG: response regulator transcription factor [Alphaproteobacteria bacterium]